MIEPPVRISEVASRRTPFGKVFDLGNNTYNYKASARQLHFGPLLREVNATITRINGGWCISNSAYPYGYCLSDDGWISFINESDTVQFRLQGVGYLHNPTKVLDLISQTPSYDTGNLARQTRQVQGVNQSTLVTWSDIFSTASGGSIDIRWNVSPDYLKEDIILNQAGRDWIRQNRPPLTPLSQTFFGFVFQVDWKGLTVEDDFDDSNGPINILKGAQNVISFPVDVVQVDADYHGIGSIEEYVQPLRKRFFKIGVKYFLMVGLRVDVLLAMADGDLIFDPSSGPTAIAAADDDGYEGSSWTNHYLGDYYCSMLTYNEHAAVSWVTPAIAAGSTINSSYFSGYLTYDAAATSWSLKFGVQDVDPASAVVWSSSNLPKSATILTETADVTGFNPANSTRYFGSGETGQTDLSTLVQDLHDKYGAFAGTDRINFRLRPTASGTQYFGLEAYEDAASNESTWEVTWTESAGGETPATRGKFIQSRHWR